MYIYIHRVKQDICDLHIIHVFFYFIYSWSSLFCWLILYTTIKKQPNRVLRDKVPCSEVSWDLSFESWKHYSSTSSCAFPQHCGNLTWQFPNGPVDCGAEHNEVQGDKKAQDEKYLEVEVLVLFCTVLWRDTHKKQNSSRWLVAQPLYRADLSPSTSPVSGDKTDVTPPSSIWLQQIATSFLLSAIRLLCVCMVILGIQTAVAIVTHQATCCALISAPRTALSPFPSHLTLPHIPQTPEHAARSRDPLAGSRGGGKN